MASRSAYDDYDEDYRSDLDAKYEEGFGQGPDLGYDDEDDDIFAGLFDDIDTDAEDDDVSPSAGKAPQSVAAGRQPAAAKPANSKKKEPTATSVVTTRVSASGVKMTLASPTRLIVTKAEPEELRAAQLAPVVEERAEAPANAVPAGTVQAEASPAAQVDPAIAALAESASRARVAADAAANAAKRAVADAVAKAAAAKAAAAEASAAEEAAQAALARSTEAEEAARAAADCLADAQREAEEKAVPAEASVAAAPHDAATLESEPEAAVVVPEPTMVTDPLFAPTIAPVNEHVNFLRKLRPGLEVPYVDPMHSVEECRIVSLFSNTGEANPKGFVWAGDDAAATRLLGLQFQLGLRPEWILPWNTYPWFTPGEANGKLLPEQVQAGLKPLIALLKVLPRASAIVAHGPEANRLAQMLLKTDNPLIWRRGLKVYKARSLHGRAFAGSKERQTEWLIEMGKAYADAMARAGLQLRR